MGDGRAGPMQGQRKTTFGFILKRVYRLRPVTRSVFTDKYERCRRLLVEARQTANLTQAKLAEQLGRPQSFVSKYERGERRLDVVEFLEVARSLGLRASDLLEEIERGGRVRRRAK